METVNRIYTLFLLFSLCAGQHYEVSILGFPVADVEQTIHSYGKIEFSTQNRGIFDLIWPAKNYYEAKYDTNSFTLKSWGKNIKQGEFKQKINAYMDTSRVIVYNDEREIALPDSTRTILTLLALVQTIKAEQIDTKWLPYEQEGMIGNARFLWADTINIWDGKDSIFCDHYRLDLKIIDDKEKINERSDYFLEEVILKNNVREIWVSRQRPKKIIKASLKTTWFPIIARVIE